MKTTVRAFALALAAVIAGGCASGAKFSDSAPSLTPVSADTGRIFFYRPSSFGAAVQPQVHLNGEVIGKSVAQGYFFVDRQPGDYKVETSTEVTRALSFVLAKGETRYVKLSVSMGFMVGHVYPELVDAEKALPELQKTKAIAAN